MFTNLAESILGGLKKSTLAQSSALRKARQSKTLHVECLEERLLLSADSNDTRGGAINIGSLGHGQPVEKFGSVGSSGDNVDYYRFVAPTSSGVRVQLQGLAADLDVELQNSAGGRIGPALRGVGTRNEDGSFRLRGGTYYVRIFKGATNAISDYVLKLTITSDGNDTRPGAIGLGSLFSGTTITKSGHVGQAGDNQDYYQFGVGRRTVQVQLQGLSADLDVELQDNNGRRIGTAGTNSGTRPEDRSYTLAGGSYYIRIFKGVGTANSAYTLRLTIT